MRSGQQKSNISTISYYIDIDDEYEHASLDDVFLMSRMQSHVSLILSCLCFCPCDILFVCCLG